MIAIKPVFWERPAWSKNSYTFLTAKPPEEAPGWTKIEAWPHLTPGTEETIEIANAVQDDGRPIAPDEYDQDRDNKLTND